MALFATDDELRAVGEPLGPGEIHDSNRYTPYGMLEKLGVEIIQSRAVAGVANATFVVCLPGSTGACRTGWGKLISHQSITAPGRATWWS